MITTIVIILLILLLVGGLPNWGLTTGYGPSGLIGLVLVIVLVLYLTHRI